MTITAITPEYSVSGQLSSGDLRAAAAQGFRSIISNRPDGEEPGQPAAATIHEQARALGMDFAHIPVVPGAITDADVAAMAQALERMPAPVLAFCRSGARAATLWKMVQAAEQ